MLKKLANAVVIVGSIIFIAFNFVKDKTQDDEEQD